MAIIEIPRPLSSFSTLYGFGDLSDFIECNSDLAEIQNSFWRNRRSRGVIRARVWFMLSQVSESRPGAPNMLSEHKWATRRSLHRRRRRRRWWRRRWTILKNWRCRGHHAGTQQQTCDDQNSFLHIQMNTIHSSRLMCKRIRSHSFRESGERPAACAATSRIRNSGRH